MSSIKKCPVCQEFNLLGTHKCAPQWDVIRAEYNDEIDPYVVFASNAEAAALKCAEKKFSDWDYPVEMELWVRENADHEWQKFDISVEPIPSFYVSRKLD